jgi:TPR repeat protein
MSTVHVSIVQPRHKMVTRRRCTFAMAYASGQEYPHDLAAAVKWHQAAADKPGGSYPLALYRFGFCLRDGRGVARDLQRALVYLRKAAEVEV